MSTWVRRGIPVALLLTLATCKVRPAVPPEERERLGRLLLKAASAGDLDQCSLLIQAGADLETQVGADEAGKQGSVPREGSTSLHVAVGREDLRLARLLLDAGADPNAKDGWGYSPLEAFFESFPEPGPEDLALLLIERGAKVNSHGGALVDNIDGRGGSTPLHLAAGDNQLRVAQALLDRGADANDRAWNGWTPIHWARSAEMIGLLKKRGADLEAKGTDALTPLAFAAIFGANETAVALIEAGADVEPVMPEWWQDPLCHHVISQLEVEQNGAAAIKVLKALIKRGADLNRTNQLGQTPLLLASSRSGEVEEEMALALLAGGANPNLKDHHGETPLHAAAGTDRPHLVRTLLEKGAPVNIKDDYGETPLHKACLAFNGSPETIELLVDGGADVHAKDAEGHEPLDLGREHRDRIAPLLKEK